MLRQKRLDHELEIQTRQIEEVLNQHELAGQVATAAVKEQGLSRLTKFDIRGKLAAGWEQAKALTRDLQIALGQSDIVVEDHEGQLRINLFQRQRPAVELLNILETVNISTPLTAVLGWSNNGQPVLLDFASEETRHALVVGQNQAGKTMLLRSIAVSLALTCRERHVQLVVIDGRESQLAQPYGHTGLQPLAYVPHLLTPVVEEAQTAAELLQFLVEESQYRAKQGGKTPAIVVLIDHLAELLASGGADILRPLTQLIRRGAKSGIHLVLSLVPSHNPAVKDILESHIPLRLVGQLESAVMAETVTECADSQAELLQGKGEFVAVMSRQLTYFQTAYVSDYDLHLCLKHLQTHRSPTLVAQWLTPRPMVKVAESNTQYTVHFVPQTPAEPENPLHSALAIAIPVEELPTEPKDEPLLDEEDDEAELEDELLPFEVEVKPAVVAEPQPTMLYLPPADWVAPPPAKLSEVPAQPYDEREDFIPFTWGNVTTLVVSEPAVPQVQPPEPVPPVRRTPEPEVLTPVPEPEEVVLTTPKPPRRILAWAQPVQSLQNKPAAVAEPPAEQQEIEDELLEILEAAEENSTSAGLSWLDGLTNMPEDELWSSLADMEVTELPTKPEVEQPAGETSPQIDEKSGPSWSLAKPPQKKFTRKFKQ